jgi:hypothetical protein
MANAIANGQKVPTSTMPIPNMNIIEHNTNSGHAVMMLTNACKNESAEEINCEVKAARIRK